MQGHLLTDGLWRDITTRRTYICFIYEVFRIEIDSDHETAV
jgi:hypothetical protein